MTSTLQGNLHTTSAGGLGKRLLGGNPRRGRQPPHPPSVGPVGPTPLPTELGRTAGRGPSPLWREPWPVCLGCHTPQCAFISDRLPPPQICPITHDLGCPLVFLPPGAALRPPDVRPVEGLAVEVMPFPHSIGFSGRMLPYAACSVSSDTLPRKDPHDRQHRSGPRTVCSYARGEVRPRGV